MSVEGGGTGLRGAVVVTGTDTAVGKTIVTAAIAAAATAAGLRVAVVKPGQTGIPAGSNEESDVETVARLAGPASARTLASYPDPLAPLAAARTSGLAPLELGTVVAAIRADQSAHDLVLVEGAGGLLAPMGQSGVGTGGLFPPVGQSGDSTGVWTIADLAGTLRAPAVVVVRAGLGTLNHTALTLEALQRRGVDSLVVIGAWPAEPVLVHDNNLVDLPGALAGALPEGGGALLPEIFRVSAPWWLAPALYGRFEPARFRAAWATR